MESVPVSRRHLDRRTISWMIRLMRDVRMVALHLSCWVSFSFLEISVCKDERFIHGLHIYRQRVWLDGWPSAYNSF